MKKLTKILCFITLISCNQIPTGSIYQKGDVVYKIDKVYSKSFDLDNQYYSTDTHGDIEIIYRAENSKIIIINKFESLLPMEENVKICSKGFVFDGKSYIKYCLDYSEAEIEYLKDTYYCISNKYIIIVIANHFTFYHVKEIIRY